MLNYNYLLLYKPNFYHIMQIKFICNYFIFCLNRVFRGATKVIVLFNQVKISYLTVRNKFLPETLL